MQKNNQIGFLVNETVSSQKSFNLIKNINEYIEENGNKEDFVVFFENSTSSVLNPKFALMSFNEIWSFHGILIATDASNCMSMQKSFSCSKKFFYVWDLEWMRNHGKEFESTIQAFSNPEVTLLARSKDHAKAIENYCNRKVEHIVNDFNLEKILRIINEQPIYQQV